MNRILMSTLCLFTALPLFAAEISNIPVTVTSQTITNVVEGNNQQGCQTCEGIRRYNWTIYCTCSDKLTPYQPATERWTITTVINRTIFSFEWNGKTVTHVDEVQLSCVTNRYKLTTKWERQ